MSDSQENVDNTCVVCFKNVVYYSIGECDHPVCYECSTRMRVLCLQNECPICRQELAKVVFTDKQLTFKKFKPTVFTDTLFDRRFKIGFCNGSANEAYLKLLEHNCNLCEGLQPFKTFASLSGHMRKDHEVHFCDLCVDNLKIFTFERKCYNRTQLAQHRRKGDPDDTSHRGHPLCEFCDTRYMDSDELFRHLRKLHLYCHLCDADGLHHYYSSHDSLRDHFRRDHFLCEEGECEGQHLTAVFRSDIDLKGHKASVHGRGMPRGASRQARTLELEFTLAPRLQPQQPHHSYQTHRPAPREEPPQEEPPRMDIVQHDSRVDTGSVQQFPSLGQVGAAPPRFQPPTKNRMGGNKFDRTKENFPALDGGGSADSEMSGGGAAGGSWIGSGAALRLNITQQGRGPSAATLRTSANPSLSIQLHRPATSASDFRLTQPSSSRVPPSSPRAPPAGSKAPPSGAKVQLSGAKTTTTGTKAPPPAPTPRRPQLRHNDEDFPELANIPEGQTQYSSSWVPPSGIKATTSGVKAQVPGYKSTTTGTKAPPTVATSRRPPLRHNDDDFPELANIPEGLNQYSSNWVPAPGVRATSSGVRAPLTGTRAPAQGAKVATMGTRAPPAGAAPRRPPLRSDDDDYQEFADIPEDLHPSIGAGSVQSSKVSIISAEQMQAQGKSRSSTAQKPPPPPSRKEFPALASLAAPAPMPKWFVQKPKEKPKPSKPKPPPEPAFNPVADFPQLSGKPKIKKGTDRSEPDSAHENGNCKPFDQKKDNKKKLENQLTETKSKKKTKEKKQTISNGMSNDKHLEYSRNDKRKGLSEKPSERVTSSPVELITNGNSYEHIKRDFPSLSVRNKPSENTKKRTPNASVSCDGLTFTNSAGQSFSAPVHSYIRPANFDQRNLDLVDKFMNILGAGICEFKSVSKAFREGFVTAEEFLDHCVRSLGGKFDTIFPELVALLPDIELQQELGVAASAKAAAMERLAACPSCGQLVTRGDAALHNKAHWPALGSGRNA